MGPVMAIFRPFAALVNAVGTGLLTTLVADDKASEIIPEKPSSETVETSCCSSKKQQPETVTSSCCADQQPEPVNQQQAAKSCCSQDKEVKAAPNKFMLVLSYAGAELLDDISKWLAFGIWPVSC